VSLAITATPIPQQTQTAVPPYIHYTPSKGSNIHVEFDYPGSWILSERQQEAGIVTISLGDSQFLTLPTPSSDEYHPRPNDFGNIDIFIFPRDPSQTPDTELELLKKNYNATSRIQVLKDYKTTINGHEASVLEYQVNDPENSLSVMFDRRIIFIVEDQIYTILFSVAEKDRGSTFEQGYDYFFNSLKILP
jgi:hypothetical protein